jgi:DNA invertase Pin-like site-specific DNA recombinase
MSKHTAHGDPCLAVAYLRASKDEQRLSPAAQRASIRAWAARESVHVVAWCLDQGVRSVTPIGERPALRAALAAIFERAAGLLVVARRDRIARDVVLAASVERAAAAVGARVVSASGEGNGDSPADAFMRTVIDGAAQYEHGLIRDRTRAALAAKRARGELVGAIPFGFALDTNGVRLVRAEQEQATIARARAMYARHLSLRAIAARLAAEGRVSRTGRPFLAEQISRMIGRKHVPTRPVGLARKAARSLARSHCARPPSTNLGRLRVERRGW